MNSRINALLALATTQHGVVTRRQAFEVGVTDDTLWRMARTGSIERVEGVLRFTSITVDPDTALWAAILRSGGVLSHATAARKLGAELHASTVHVTVPYQRNTVGSPSATLHRSRRLPETHVSRSPGSIPLTTAPRTFVDLSAPSTGLSDDKLLSCLDAWLIKRRVSLRWLYWFVEEEAKGLDGRTRARSLLNALSRPQVESVAERDLAQLLARGGLAPFSTQHAIWREGALVGRVDFAWPPERVALELDGYLYHSGPGVFTADRQRGNEIRLAGWTLLRTTPSEVRTAPSRLIATIREVLDLQRSLHKADQTSG